MTALCGGGTSSAQPGLASQLVFTSTVIAEVFAAFEMPWAAFLAGFFPLQTYATGTLCGTDPPDDPGITLVDAIAFANPFNPVTWIPASVKFEQLLTRYLWYKLCRCDTAATPAAPAPVANPGIATGGTVVGGGPGVPCFDVTQFIDLRNYNFAPAGAYYEYDVTGLFFGSLASGVATSPPIPGDTATALLPAVPPLSMTFKYTNIVDPLDVDTGAVYVQWYKADGSQLSQSGAVGMSSTFIQTYTVAVPSLAAAFQVFINTVKTATQRGTASLEISWLCSGAGGLVQSCCPPDPTLSAQLQLILAMVTLLQRALAPFASTPGTVHAGLSGAGTLAVSSLLGVKVHLTFIPAALGSASGEPTFYFDVGWLSILTPDGLIEERRVTAVDTAWTPRLMSEATVLGYSLGAGVIATITELHREP